MHHRILIREHLGFFPSIFRSIQGTSNGIVLLENLKFSISKLKCTLRLLIGQKFFESPLSLSTTANIRENLGGFPSIFWSRQGPSNGKFGFRWSRSTKNEMPVRIFEEFLENSDAVCKIRTSKVEEHQIQVTNWCKALMLVILFRFNFSGRHFADGSGIFQ